MHKKEYSVTYKDRKNAHESKAKTVVIDLNEYNDSYAENQFILRQYYPARMVRSMIYTDKVDFLSKMIRKTIGEKAFVRKDELKRLVSQLDNDFANIAV